MKLINCNHVQEEKKLAYDLEGAIALAMVYVSPSMTVVIPACPLGTCVIVTGGAPVAVVITLIVEPFTTAQ